MFPLVISTVYFKSCNKVVLAYSYFSCLIVVVLRLKSKKPFTPVKLRPDKGQYLMEKKNSEKTTISAYCCAVDSHALCFVLIYMIPGKFLIINWPSTKEATTCKHEIIKGSLQLQLAKKILKTVRRRYSLFSPFRIVPSLALSP